MWPRCEDRHVEGKHFFAADELSRRRQGRSLFTETVPVCQTDAADSRSFEALTVLVDLLRSSSRQAPAGIALPRRGDCLEAIGRERAKILAVLCRRPEHCLCNEVPERRAARDAVGVAP